MSQTLDRQETPQDENMLRRVLGLRAAGTVVFDGEDFLDPCPTCGHRAPVDAPPELPSGDPVTEVPVDRAAVGQAHRTVVMAVEVLDQRRPATQLTGLVAPRVLRYLRAVPVEASGLRGGARLLSFHPSQPHEGAVEVAGSVRLRGRRRALAASFTVVGLDRSVGVLDYPDPVTGRGRARSSRPALSGRRSGAGARCCPVAAGRAGPARRARGTGLLPAAGVTVRLPIRTVGDLLIVSRVSPVPYPLPPMVAVSAEELPVGEKWVYEPKFDGFRCLAHAAGGRVRLQSRQLRSLTRYFPEIVAAVAELGEDVVLDGELVVWQQGRLDFAALQQRLQPSTAGAGRLAAVAPAAYVVFDVLAARGKDLRPLPWSERRRRVEELLGARLPHGLVLMPASADPAVGRLWMRQHTASGIEGVVAKRVDQTYRAGARAWRKIKTRLTAEAIVGGVLGSPEEPDALIVGRYGAHGRLRVAGRTTPLPAAARAQLQGLLTAPSGEHPWPEAIPSARFGQRPSEPVEYVQVAPNVVVELEVDAAYELGRWRHPVRFVRSRPDLHPEEIIQALGP